MPSRMSNKDRIARLAAEKQAATEEKETKKKTTTTKGVKKARTSRTRAAATKTAARMKAVWVICDQSGGPVKSFGFNEKSAAEKEAKKLTADKNKMHFVKMDKVPME